MSELKNNLRPGDIINIQGGIQVTPLFKDIKEFFWDNAINGAIKIIENTQKSVFCQKYKPKDILCMDNHTTMYLGDGKVFSYQPPYSLIFDISEYENEPNRIMTVIRMNPDFFKRQINDEDISILKKYCQIIVDMRDGNGNPVKYDIGQNADILVNKICGYPWQDQVHIFDADGNDTSEDIDLTNPRVMQHMVCSVSVAAITNAWRHERKKLYGDEIRQPFKTLNPNAWNNKTIENFSSGHPESGHWAIGSTFPCMYALAKTHFVNEYDVIGRYLKGATYSCG